MSNEYDHYEEDDVIIEGSDLFQVLTDMGYTDFECTPANRSEFHNDFNEVNDSENSSSLIIEHNWLWNFIQKIRYSSWLYKSKVKSYYGIAQLEIISQLDPLLIDHSMMIQEMLNKNQTLSRKSHTFQWIIFILTNSILVTGTLLYKPLRIPGFMSISSINTLIACRIYNNLHSINNLKELISIQNDIYYLYKKTLKIFKNGYCLTSSQKYSQKSFSKLEIGRIKYLQSMCECFIQSMEIITRTCYRISMLLMNFMNKFCKNNYIDNLITTFDDMTFTINGEITYEKLKQHYYVYILVQSEMTLIFSILYQEESIYDHNLYSTLMKIIKILLRLFEKKKIKLNSIIEQFQNSRVTIIHREMKNGVGNKLQDLYMHVDLLARKIQSAYNIVDSIIDDIDSCANNENSAKIIDTITQKMNETYKHIDTARNFAEFNNLLIGKFRYNQTLENNDKWNSRIIEKIENELPVVHDTDPQIIDEVFEEYIKEEYLKPLYEDHDIDSLERSKLDKLLVKNFMCELKEVLVDKYKTMSERETRALLCYRKKKNYTEQENSVENNYEQKVPAEIPPPPPLPQSVMDESSSITHMKIRTPVPLPRSIHTTISPIIRRRRKFDQDIEPEILGANEKFLMNMNMDIRSIKLPTFQTNEETFIGSGENSDEEIIQDNETEDENN